MAAKSLPEENSTQQREFVCYKKSNNETLFTPLRHVRDILWPVTVISNSNVKKSQDPFFSSRKWQSSRVTRR